MKNPITNLAAENSASCLRRESRPVASIEVHFDMLADMLRLPTGTVIESVRTLDNQNHTLEIRLTHPDLPLVGEGSSIPPINPIYSRTEEGDKTHWEFLRWA